LSHHEQLRRTSAAGDRGLLDQVAQRVSHTGIVPYELRRRALGCHAAPRTCCPPGLPARGHTLPDADETTRWTPSPRLEAAVKLESQTHGQIRQLYIVTSEILRRPVTDNSGILGGFGGGLCELGGVEVGVGAVGGQELVVGAVFDDVAVFHDEDEVGVSDGGQTVSDDEAGAVLA
jgi:hypothetical protein